MSPSSMHRTLLLTLLIGVSLARDCYFMNGGRTPTTHQPCKADLASDDHSSCCSAANDICLDSGLCLANNGLIYETACTDPTWESNACPSICPDKSTEWRGTATGNWTEGEENGFWQVMTCQPGAVCCRRRDSEPNCCEEEYLIDFSVGMPDNTTATDTTGDSQGDGADVGSGSNATSSDCKNRETTVGAAVGASLGAALVAALGAIWFLVQRQRKLVATIEQYQSAAANTAAYTQPSGPVSRNLVRPVVELDVARKYELSTQSQMRT
ncbi:hypothetical protein BDW59DRAFT_162626 [Aspergillus cavernicola]|uniref:Uncharacterized protein n=1 Tax=Aspergillus cavernicola TaxID=176166 RepID=A0ABR4I984_9EURO